MSCQLYTTRGFHDRSNIRIGEIWHGCEGFDGRPDDVHISHNGCSHNGCNPTVIIPMDISLVKDVQGDSTRAISVAHRKFFEAQGPARV